MTQVNVTPGTEQSRYDGTDYVCRTCNSEIMVKHAGDEAKGYGRSTYVCTCGTPMELEHGSGGQASS